MTREKKLVHKVQMTDDKRNIICQLGNVKELDIQSTQDIQDAFGTIQERRPEPHV